MQWYWILLIVVLVILVAASIGLYFLGKKTETKKAEQDKMMAEVAQTMTLLVIDKKKMKMKDSGLPQQVIDSTPWYFRGTKTPVVKVKAGPRIMTLLCDPNIYEDLPVKKEVKVVVSGIYITAIKGAHGKREATAPKKKTLVQKLQDKIDATSTK